MMPLAPTPIVPIPTKPKIGFSIESLVGKDSRSANCTITTTTAAAATSNGGGSVINANSISRPSSSNAVETSSRTSSSPSPSSSPRDRMDKRARSVSPLMIEGYDHPHHHHHHHHHHAHHHSHSEPQTSGSPSTPPVRPNVRCESPVSPVSSTGAVPVSSAAHHPIVSIHAPTASMAPNPFMDTLSSLKGIYAPEPTYTNGMVPGLMAPQPLPCAPLAHVPQHVGFPNLSPLFLGNIGTVGPHQLHREAYPLYPWLLSRQGRFLGHRFQGPDAPAFLLQPFRKPKRIRTAFSPSQLLKLEHAFEKNHYVVGAERKHLAQTLSLTETQVKVWFQNRRTKHKRLKQEEEQSQSSPPSPKKKGTHHLNKWKMETNQSGEENSSEAS